MKARMLVVLLALAPALAGCYRVKLDGFSYEPPKQWIREEPTSEHRLIQYRLKGETKEIGDARLVLYYFGPQGTGDIGAQIERWARSFQQPDGQPSIDVAVIDQVESNGLTVHTIEVRGTYVATKADGEQLNKPDRSMEAAVVLTEAGPYYFKVVGPTPTVRRWESTYEEVLASLRPEPVKARPDDSPESVEMR